MKILKKMIVEGYYNGGNPEDLQNYLNPEEESSGEVRASSTPQKGAQVLRVHPDKRRNEEWVSLMLDSIYKPDLELSKPMSHQHCILKVIPVSIKIRGACNKSLLILGTQLCVIGDFDILIISNIILPVKNMDTLIISPHNEIGGVHVYKFFLCA